MNTPPCPDTDRAPWLAPELSCDIVMKGGITSGIVYPRAIAELARRYRFRSIGGTSAGAIAAAATAAAELGRESGAGFACLEGVPDYVGETDAGAPRMLHLFQPSPSTRRLFGAAVGFVRYGTLRAVGNVVWSFWRFPLLAFALAVAAIALAIWAGVSWALAIAVIAFTPWIALVGLLRDLVHAFGKLAENDFGLCRLGPPAPGGSRTKSLTLWLYDLLQQLAGKPVDRPLTFADLWGVPLPAHPDELTDAQRDRLERLGWDPQERRIDLQVMTTNLTNGRPMRLPVCRYRYERRAEDGGGLLFDPEEWERFFPPEVMSHLLDYSSIPGGNRGALLGALAQGRQLRCLPSGYALPVVVAARLSLSFPVLISAVPLWEIRQRENAPPQLRRVLFSDGGISSNFPVHFFDAPLPRRPTFAINLAGFERGEAPAPGNPASRVVDPIPATGRARETWKDIDTMFDFFVAIKDAMQNWRDNAQARLPGFRERVIHVKLAHKEGGLNLAMPPETIADLADGGRFAGERLVERFSGAPAGQAPAPAESWDEHRWTRLRVTLAALERLFRRFEIGFSTLDDGDGVTRPYRERLALGGDGPYALQPAARLQLAVDTVAAYRALVESWGDGTLDDASRPHPVVALRLVPPV